MVLEFHVGLIGLGDLKTSTSMRSLGMFGTATSWIGWIRLDHPFVEHPPNLTGIASHISHPSHGLVRFCLGS